MKYHLNNQQYTSLWDKYNISRIMEHIDERINFWDSTLKSKFNLEYEEINENDTNGDESDPDGWYGTLVGDEKHISWFLLQI